MYKMDEKTEKLVNSNVKDGEKVLWVGKAEKAGIVAKPFNKSLPLLWAVCGVFCAGFLAIYLPYAAKKEFSGGDIAVGISIMLILPALLAYLPIKDYISVNSSKLFYVITDRSLITFGGLFRNSLKMTADMPIIIDWMSDDSGSIRFGASCKRKATEARKMTISGQKGDDSTKDGIEGLTFYNVKDPEAVCRIVREAMAGSRTAEAAYKKAA